MGDNYILDAEGKPVLEPDILKWAEWFESNDRKVAKDMIGGVQVSTVFLGMDHSFGGGTPILYETMIFSGPHDEYQTRASTREEALEQHRAAVARAKGE